MNGLTDGFLYKLMELAIAWTDRATYEWAHKTGQLDWPLGEHMHDPINEKIDLLINLLKNKFMMN